MADTQSTLIGLNSRHIEVRYGTNLLVPSPLIGLTQSITRDDTGARLVTRTTRTLTGQILTSGIDYSAVKAKQDALINAFSLDGQELTIVATQYHPYLASGTYILSGIYPNVISIDIPEGTQFNRLDYNIVLEDLSSPAGVSGVQSLTNTWTFRENDNECSVDINHTISAQGIDTASGVSSNALANAVARVRSLLGLANLPASFPYYVQPPSGTNVGFYELTTSREETVNIDTATYGVTEVFKLVSGVQPFIDERNSQYTVNTDGIVTVTINGTVKGLGRTNDGAIAGIGRSGGGTGFANALSGFNNRIRPLLPTDALNLYSKYLGSGILATGKTQSFSITETPCLGTVSYSVSYTDDSTQNLPSGIAELSSSVQKTDPTVLFASHAIPFRAIGNLLQDIFTSSPGTYVVQSSCRALNTGDRVVNTNRAIEVLEQEMIRLQPNAADYITLKLTGRSFTVDDITRSANATYTWTYTKDIATIPSPTAPISLGRIS